MRSRSESTLRGWINRWRRRLWHALAYRMLFGERDPFGPHRPVRPFSRLAPSVCIEGEAGLSLADHVFIGQFNFIEASAGLTIEEGVQITNFCSLVTHSTHRSIRLMGRLSAAAAGARPGDIRAPIHLGAYSYIGPHSLIEAGTRLGRGTLVAAYSRVRGEHPAFAVLAGNPAQVVGDTRQRDGAWLQRHPELRQTYADWAGGLPDDVIGAATAVRMRVAVIGDGLSPHLAKWARAMAPHVELWLASSTGLSDELARCVPPARCLVLGTQPDAAGGNLGLLRQLPRLGRWLAALDADWINPHYLTSHGSLAWAARIGWRLRGGLLASAWGSDVLLTPQRHGLYRWALRRVLGAARLATSDSQHMAGRMREFGSREVMVFPFGLDQLPPAAPVKQPWLVFTNRAFEPIYRPTAVLDWFAGLAAQQPDARLVMANDGSLRAAVQAEVDARGLTQRVRLVGRLDATAQADLYSQAQWFISLPQSDSVSVSVIEAMAHGCVPLLSDLPANRELVEHGQNGCIVPPDAAASTADLPGLLARAGEVAQRNRAWVAEHGLFGPGIDRLLVRLRELAPARRLAP